MNLVNRVHFCLCYLLWIYYQQKKDSQMLQKAWDLDQKALLRAKNKTKQKELWKNSLEICKKLLKKFPKEINLLLKIATIYQHQKKFGNAMYYLKKAQKYYPKNFLVAHNMGNFYRAKGNKKITLKYYRMAVKLSNNNQLIKKGLEDYIKTL